MARKPSNSGGNDPIILTFAGGVNAVRREADIDINECTAGKNFDLKSQQLSLSPRKSLEVVGIVPGGKAIRGFAQLVKTDGTISTLIQSGGDVYSWDGTSTGFALVGTVDTGARLRTSRDSNVTNEDIVIITDLAKVVTVKQWNGTTFQDFTHNLSNSLFAKYCKIFNERAYFANVRSGTDTPHVILASEGGDVHTLTVANRPASAVNAEDAWFLPIPDLRPINGLEFAFGTTIVATVSGRIYQLIEEPLQVATGTISEKRLDEFYSGSSLAGDEAMVQIGNDVAVGLKGRIELMSGVQQFGDVRTDDLSLPITPLIEEVTSWTMAYDRQQQIVYCLPGNSSSIWVFYKNVAFSNIPEIRNLSSWSEFTTDAAIEMTNSIMMAITDPVSLQETVLLGSQDGRIYNFSGERGVDGQEIFPISFSSNSTTLKNDGGFTGGIDGQKGIFSIWINMNSTGGTNQYIFDAGISGVASKLLFLWANNDAQFRILNTASAVILSATNTIATLQNTDWHHVLASWDLSVPTFQLYIDNVNAVPNITTLVNDTIPYSSINLVEILANFLNKDRGIAEVYLNQAAYLNISDENNRRKFIQDGGQPADLGSDGSNPTGNAPWIYLHNQPETFHVNIGTGSDLIVSNGSLVQFDIPLGKNGISIAVERTSKVFIPVPIDDEIFDIRGWITYKKSGAFTTNLHFHFGGSQVDHKIITLTMPAADDGGFYQGAYYYGDGTPYSSKRKGHHHRRQNFGPIEGRGQNFHLEVEVEATTDFEIDEIGLLFESSSR